jgi:hypothetical protein
MKNCDCGKCQSTRDYNIPLPLTTENTMWFDYIKYLKFKKSYELALAENKRRFIFDSHEFKRGHARQDIKSMSKTFCFQDFTYLKL